MDRSPNPTHDELRLDLAAYALGALSEGEARAVRDHIADCENCRHELDDFLEVERWLAGRIEGELPAGFAADVMSRVSREAPTESDAFTARQRMRRLVALALAAALVATAAGLGFVAYRLQKAEEELRSLRIGMHEIARGGSIVELEGAGVQARLVYGQDRGLLVVSGLPPAPDRQTYQLWLKVEGKPVSVRTFEARDGLTVIETVLPATEFAGALVTVEPDGGSSAPNLNRLVLESI